MRDGKIDIAVSLDMIDIPMKNLMATQLNDIVLLAATARLAHSEKAACQMLIKSVLDLCIVMHFKMKLTR